MPESRETIEFAAFFCYNKNQERNHEDISREIESNLETKRERGNSYEIQQGRCHAGHAAFRWRDVHAGYPVCLLRHHGSPVHRVQEPGYRRQHRRQGYHLVRLLVRRRAGRMDRIQPDADPLRHRRSNRLCEKRAGTLRDGSICHLHGVQLLHLRFPHAARDGLVRCGLLPESRCRYGAGAHRQHQDAGHGHARCDLHRLRLRLAA